MDCDERFGRRHRAAGAPENRAAESEIGLLENSDLGSGGAIFVAKSATNTRHTKLAQCLDDADSLENLFEPGA